MVCPPGWQECFYRNPTPSSGIVPVCTRQQQNNIKREQLRVINAVRKRGIATLQSMYVYALQSQLKLVQYGFNLYSHTKAN